MLKLMIILHWVSFSPTLMAKQLPAPEKKIAPGIAKLGAFKYRLLPAEMKPNPLQNLSVFLQTASIVPEPKSKTSNGVLAGFRIVSINKGTILEQGGLKKNDLLLFLGDHKLDSLGSTIMAVQALRNTKAFTIKVKRGNKVLTFSYEVATPSP